MISFIASATKANDYPDSKKEIVFVGRSNVGKSSLINALYGKIAYVGKTPGKTRLLNFFNVDNKYSVCDVPGYGFANRSQKEIIEFGEMMEEYFSTRKPLKLSILILDIRRVPNKDDKDMLDYLKENKKNYLIITNKIDKLSNAQRIESIKKICEVLDVEKDKIVQVSASNKTNIEYLKNLLNEKFS